MADFSEFDTPQTTPSSAAAPAGGDFSEFDTAPAPARSFWQRAYDAAAGGAEKVGESFSNLGHTVASAARGAVDLVSPISKTGGLQVPFGQLADPAYRHELERGISDTVTGGLAEKAANAVSPEFAAAAPAEHAAAPDARALGNAAGVALPSPFGALGKGAAKLVPGAGPLAAGARGVVGYEAAAVPQAATQAALNAPAGHRLEAAAGAVREAATDPASLVTAGAVPAAIEGVKKQLDVAASKAPAVKEAAKRRAVKDLGKDITSAEGVKSRVTDQKRIAEVNDRLYDLAEKNPELRAAFSGPAEKALPKIQAFKDRIAQPLDRLYDAIDKQTGGGLDPQHVVDEFRRMAKEDARSVGGLDDAARLEKLADRFERVYITDRVAEQAPKQLARGTPSTQLADAIDEASTGDRGGETIYRGGAIRNGEPTWFANNKDYAGHYGDPVEYKLKSTAKVLDLTDMGVDMDRAELKRQGLPIPKGISSGEMYEWAEKAANELKGKGYDAVKVQQWNAEYGSEPEPSVLVLNHDEVSSALSQQRNSDLAGMSASEINAQLDQLKKLRENAKGVAATALDAQIREREAALAPTMVGTAPSAALPKIPTRVFRAEVTDLLKKSDSIMGGIEGTPRFEALQHLYEAGKQIIDKHIDGSGLPTDQIAQIRDINNGYFLASRAEEAIASRGFKEANKPGFKFPTSVRSAVHGGGLAGLASAAALGGPRAVVHALPYIAGTELATHALPAVAKNLNLSLARGSYGRAVNRLATLARKTPRAEFIGQAMRAGLPGRDAQRIFDAANAQKGASP